MANTKDRSDQERRRNRDDKSNKSNKGSKPSQQNDSEAPRSADTGARNTQGNLGTTQREWDGKSPQDMGEDG